MVPKMARPFDWDAYYGKSQTAGRIEWSRVALDCLATPASEDARWLIDGLKDERKWFVAVHFYWAPAIAEVFFQPLMDAGIDECEPSGCRPFITPCSSMFGVRRTLEYLYDVIESGCDRRKTGALLCIYMASFPSAGNRRQADIEANGKWRRHIKEREAELLLRTYLDSSDRLVRFAALRRLPMSLSDYPKHLRPLAAQVIEAAKLSKDRFTRQYVRHRLTPNPTSFPDTWPSGVECESDEEA